MSYVEILTDNGLTAEQWDNSLFTEYLGMMWWKNLMGTSTNAVIQVKEDLVKKPGDAITIGLRGLMEGGLVTGNSRGLGNEGSVEFFNQRITIDNVRHLIKIKDIPMTQKRVGFDVLSESKDALNEKAQFRLEDEITTALNDTATGRVRGRYLYGALDSNWNATHTTALTAIDDTADKFSTGMIQIAKRKALIPINATAKIRPMKVKNGKNFEEWFCSVNHPYAIRDLKDHDAAWKNAQLNLTPRSDSASPLFSGSSFVGSWDGVLVYSYDRLSLVSSTIQVAHNFLLGAQAAAVVWGQRSKFGEQYDDLGHEVSFETHEIRGIAKLAFSRSTVEDNGVVHVFSAAVAD
jgi:N4-gp56 family major capsid protein